MGRVGRAVRGVDPRSPTLERNQAVIYGYKCPECKQTYISHMRGDRLDRECSVCGHSPLHRDFSGISLQRPMEEHWNATVNQPISSNKQFDEALKRETERMSVYTQVDQKLERIDPEQAMVGVTPEGLESTNRERMKRQQKPIDLDRL